MERNSWKIILGPCLTFPSNVIQHCTTRGEREHTQQGHWSEQPPRFAVREPQASATRSGCRESGALSRRGGCRSVLSLGKMLWALIRAVFVVCCSRHSCWVWWYHFPAVAGYRSAGARIRPTRNTAWACARLAPTTTLITITR